MNVKSIPGKTANDFAQQNEDQLTQLVTSCAR